MHYSQEYLLGQVQELQSELVKAKAQLLVMQKELDSVQLSEQDLRLQLRRQLAKEQERVSALQWDLEKE